MKQYKGYGIEKNIYGYFVIYFGCRFWKFDTMSGLKRFIDSDGRN